MVQLPVFNSEGVLPPGDYELSIAELKDSRLVTGHGVESAHWDSEWRHQLVDSLAVMVGQLWQVGVTDIFIDGSFVEDKDHPNDIDGYFAVEVTELRDKVRFLNSIDPWSVWTWSPASRTRHKNYPKLQLLFVDLGGMDRQEASSKLNSLQMEKLNDQKRIGIQRGT